ncbi:MAG TPA: DUF423 domain-containing protein [Steroidobacteraceae bacterium]|nr:DUF423 domain-containing protein [Steroidobacteraceae bacterium]
MRLRYTFVIDEHSRFILESRIFLRTILAGGVAPTDIVAQVTARSGEVGKRVAAQFGVRALDLPLGPDGAYCNKINQLFTLADEDFDVLVACDTDVAIMRPLDEMATPEFVRARRVDQENPPLAVLERIREYLGVPQEPELAAPTCCPEARTYAMNCNGGMLLIPRRFMQPLGETWLGYATRLTEQRHLLEQWVNHIDQVSWAFAMLKLALPFQELPLEYNFPTNLARRRIPPHTYARPVVLHYHRSLDRRGRLRPTGVGLVDESISEANRRLREGGGNSSKGSAGAMTGCNGRRVLAAAGVLLALATVAGALGAHTLKGHWAAQQLEVYETAVRYQFYHSLGLLGIGLALRTFNVGALRAAAVLVLVGIILFSGSLYALTLGAPRVMGAVTPLGGVALITGWMLFAYGAWRELGTTD